MKKTFTIFAAILLMAGFSNTVMAQGTSATIDATPAGAVLIVPMTIGQDAPLHFGSITLLSTAAAGTVTLPSSTTDRVFTAGVEAALVTSDPATNAAYHVTGTYSETYALTLPESAILTEKGGVALMTVDAFTARFNVETIDAITSTLSATGTDNFTLGATLNLVIGQIGGIYAGDFPVTVDYN
ncbi:MAG TPA: DUF4402 domain-containing protein [Prolixibacteraceae bacterium]|nr:DUF4402 domain-containing protein [Prolixibacteraceae bacterium]